jgi:putative chitinase
MLTYDPATFFKEIRPFFGNTLTQRQVDNMQVLLGLGAQEMNMLNGTPLEVNSVEAMAYVLATVRHEAGVAMAPIAEIGKGQGHAYGGKVDLDGKSYTTPDQLYYGRGHVQLTWRSNYHAMGAMVHTDLVSNPDLMLTIQVSAHVAIKGMLNGSFRGHKLADYFVPGHTPDPIQARRIINGVPRGETLPDRAELIAGYYTHFLAALQAAHQAAVPPASQVAVVVGSATRVAAAAAALAASGPAAAEPAVAPGTVAAVVVVSAPAAEELLAPPALVADVSATAAIHV